MNGIKIADFVFDTALVVGLLGILAFLWTFAFVCLQITATCGFVALAALLVLQRLDKPEPPPPPPRMPRAQPARDFISQEEYDETPLGP